MSTPTEGHQVGGYASEAWKRPVANLAEALVREGRFDKAEELTHIIRPYEFRVRVLIDLAEILVQAGRIDEARIMLDEAKEIIPRIQSSGEQWRALNNLVLALVRAGHPIAAVIEAAFSLLDPRNLDEFLHALAAYAFLFEHQEPELSVDVLREATSIAGWVRSDWRKIHERLAAPEFDAR